MRRASVPLESFDPRVLMCPIHHKGLVALATHPEADRRMLCFQCLKGQEIDCEDITAVFSVRGLEKIIKPLEITQDRKQNINNDHVYINIESLFENAITNLRYYKELLKRQLKHGAEDMFVTSTLVEMQNMKKRLVTIIQRVADDKDMDEHQATEYMDLYHAFFMSGKKVDAYLNDIKLRVDRLASEAEGALKKMEETLRNIVGLDILKNKINARKNEAERMSPNRARPLAPSSRPTRVRPRKGAVTLAPGPNYDFEVKKVKFVESITGTDQLVFASDNNLHLVETANFSLMKVYERAHSSAITNMKYFEKRALLFTSSADYKLKSWKIDNDILPRQTFEFPGPVTSFDMMEKTKLAVGGDFPSINVVDSPTREADVHSISPYTNVICLRYLPWRSCVVFSSEKGALAIYDLKSRSIVSHLNGYALYHRVGVIEVDVPRMLIYTANTDKNARLCVWYAAESPEEKADHFELKSYVVGQIIYTISTNIIAMSVKKHPVEFSKAMVLIINKKEDDDENGPELFIQELPLEEKAMAMMPLTHIMEKDLIVAGCNRVWDNMISLRTIAIKSGESQQQKQM